LGHRTLQAISSKYVVSKVFSPSPSNPIKNKIDQKNFKTLKQFKNLFNLRLVSHNTQIVLKTVKKRYSCKILSKNSGN
jgi:hypothetical protein